LGKTKRRAGEKLHRKRRLNPLAKKEYQGQKQRNEFLQARERQRNGSGRGKSRGPNGFVQRKRTRKTLVRSKQKVGGGGLVLVEKERNKEKKNLSNL